MSWIFQGAPHYLTTQKNLLFLFRAIPGRQEKLSIATWLCFPFWCNLVIGSWLVPYSLQSRATSVPSCHPPMPSKLWIITSILPMRHWRFRELPQGSLVVTAEPVLEQVF
jgi:hypothetical protein